MKTPALGCAVMLLRGAIDRLQTALQTTNKEKILEEYWYASNLKYAYLNSKNKANKCSFISKIHIEKGEEALLIIDKLLHGICQG